MRWGFSYVESGMRWQPISDFRKTSSINAYQIATVTDGPWPSGYGSAI